MKMLAALLLVLCAAAAPLFVFAATVNPSSSDLTVLPGTPATATISVENTTASGADYSVTFLEASFGTDAEHPSFSPLSGNLVGSLTASPSRFHLEAGEKKTVDVKVSLPSGIPGASPSVAVLVSEKGEGNGTGSVQGAVASLLFLHVPGGLTQSLRIDSFAATPAFSWGKPVMISAVFTNDGEETELAPSEVRVFGPFGHELGRGTLSASPKHLPPGTTRSLSAPWPGSEGFKPVLLGTYRFELWDGDRLYATARSTFCSPIVVIAATLAFLCVLFGILTVVRRLR